MIPLEVIRARILGAVPTLPVVALPLNEVAGHATVSPVIAEEAVPPFANSAMDGYAVRAADTEEASASQPAVLRVVGDLPAGRAPDVTVGSGEAVRIMTGAVVPDGADAVVMVEVTTTSGDEVRVSSPADVGDHVRSIGGDVAPGDRVLAPGTTLGPAHIGVLASIGHDVVEVRRPARVGVLSTGDELVAATEPGTLAPGRIRDANRPMLIELLAHAGCLPVDLGIASDDEESIIRTLSRALDTCDAVITSGGVSVGDYDYVKAALDRLGTLEWNQVAIKPAKPLAFGMVDGRPVFGLPGNPVSSLVSFELFVRPALLQMGGHSRRFRPEVEAVAESGMRRRPDGKIHFDRVTLTTVDGRFQAARVGSQASNVLSATAAADGLAVLPDGEGVRAGDAVRVMLIHASPDH